MNKRVIYPFNFPLFELEFVKLKTLSNFEPKIGLKKPNSQKHCQNINGDKAKENRICSYELVLRSIEISADEIILDGYEN